MTRGAKTLVINMRKKVLGKPLITYRCQKIDPCFSRRVHNNARPFLGLCNPKKKLLITSLIENSSSQNIRAADPKHWGKQCCGSVTFWYVSGSVYPYHEVRIRNQIRIRFCILLFSSVADKMPTQYEFLFQRVFAYYF